MAETYSGILSTIHGGDGDIEYTVATWVDAAKPLGTLENELAALLEQQRQDPKKTSVTVTIRSTDSDPVRVSDLAVRLPLAQLIEAKRAEIVAVMQRLADIQTDLDAAVKRMLTYDPASVPDVAPMPKAGGVTGNPTKPHVDASAKLAEAVRAAASMKPLVGPGRGVSDDAMTFRTTGE